MLLNYFGFTEQESVEADSGYKRALVALVRDLTELVNVLVCIKY